MDFTIGSLELTRTNQAHVGTRALLDTSKKVVTDSFGNESNINKTITGEKKTKGAFETYLMEAMSEMNGQQVKLNSLQEQVITDPDSVDIHDVTIAMAKAQMSLNLAQTVIDRVISGWNELSQTR